MIIEVPFFSRRGLLIVAQVPMEQLKITNVDIWVKLWFQVSPCTGMLSCGEEGREKIKEDEKEGRGKLKRKTLDAVRSSFHEIYRSSPVN